MADNLAHPASLSDLQNLFNTNTYVAVDFYADWCGPCKQIAPIYANLSKQHAVDGILAFAKVNVDSARDIAAAYRVSAMPTFMFFKEGKQVAVNGDKLVQGADVRKLSAAAEKLGELAKKRAAGQ
ncbi:thioredoxin 1 [Teratosphaeria nubilosa]|uniref:Thioredoxin 1 n=1 Tax=Teratosphaeria nubilosa TaxID=161662 RepID=A0A6G1KY97_9PEZI|nr:thioredoxin 1 [Teratosphaeria nubilosa]